MTVEPCAQRCRAKGFEYAGVQYARQCFCGNSYGKLGKAPDKECSMPCDGDPKETCGGTYRNDVYKLGK